MEKQVNGVVESWPSESLVKSSSRIAKLPAGQVQEQLLEGATAALCKQFGRNALFDDPPCVR